MGAIFSKPKPNQDVVIILVGATGTGKSQLINTAVGRNSTTVGHTLEPCTRKVKSVSWKYQNRDIVFLDTPALEDDDCPSYTLEDLEKRLKKWMTSAKVPQATGILYLHRITDNRVTTPSARTMAAFRKLCGTNTDVSSRIILVTTMWDKIKPEDGGPREMEIKTKYWNEMLASGSHTVRFDKSAASVEKAVDLILG